MSLVGVSRGFLPQKIFTFGGSLFSALVMKEMTSNKRERQVFSVLTSAYFRGSVNIEARRTPSTSTLSISKSCMMFG